MDGGGCLDQPLTRSGPVAAEEFGAPAPAPRRPRGSDDLWRGVGAASCLHRPLCLADASIAAGSRAGVRELCGCRRRPASALPPRSLLLAATLGYGAVAGDHLPVVIDWMKDARDAAANAAGFRIAAVSLTGQKEVSREEVLAVAGVTGRASLLFLDADAARTRLMANPWIADAAVLKLYPDRLQITITERQAFALWQKDGRVGVIAADGTVLEPLRRGPLPSACRSWSARGAERAGQATFSPSSTAIPTSASQLRASIMVADRRWNLRLKNGIDVRLPETDVEQALERLVALDREKKILSRDITRRRSAPARPGDRAPVGCGRAGARRGAQGQEEEKGRRRMSALHYGLTPKMKPISPRRSALVAALDVGSSKIACLIARLRPHPPQQVLTAPHPCGRGARLSAMPHARGIKAGAVVDLAQAEECDPPGRRLRRAHGVGATLNRSCSRSRPGGSPANCSPPRSSIEGSAVSEGDIARVLAAGSRHSVREGRAVLHSLPIGYSLDGGNGIRDPRGMLGQRSASTCTWRRPTSPRRAI